MKALVAGLIWLGSSVAFAQPDPRDSIILESKGVDPRVCPRGFSVRVWITNKDSLSGLILPLLESSVSGGAYAKLAHRRTFNGVITPLSGSFTSGTADFSFYHNDSPDTILLTGSAGSVEPPNSTRKGIWDIKFDLDASGNYLGAFDLDSITFPPNVGIGFVDQSGMSIEVNFVKSLIAVYIGEPLGCCDWGFGCYLLGLNGLRCEAGKPCSYYFGVPCTGDWTFSVVSGPGTIDSNGIYTFPGPCEAADIPVTVKGTMLGDSCCHHDSIRTAQCWFYISVVPAKGDLNCDLSLSPADVVWILNGVMLGMPPPAGTAACDLNCDGQSSPADVVLELNAVFLGSPFPC